MPKNQYIWEPSVIVMKHGGELELTFFNDDQKFHMAFLSSDGEREVLEIPVATASSSKISSSSAAPVVSTACVDTLTHSTSKVARAVAKQQTAAHDRERSG